MVGDNDRIGGIRRRARSGEYIDQYSREVMMRAVRGLLVGAFIVIVFIIPYWVGVLEVIRWLVCLCCTRMSAIHRRAKNGGDSKDYG